MDSILNELFSPGSGICMHVADWKISARSKASKRKRLQGPYIKLKKREHKSRIAKPVSFMYISLPTLKLPSDHWAWNRSSPWPQLHRQRTLEERRRVENIKISPEFCKFMRVKSKMLETTSGCWMNFTLNHFTWHTLVTQCSEHCDGSVALPAATSWGASRSLFKGSERDKKAPAALKFRKKK